jgi:hypothetical protein
MTFNQLDPVLAFVAERETQIRPDIAEAIVRLPPGTLLEELRRVFESYPEKDLARRIKRYKIFERGRRCYFEGEDRTRYFLWQDSPFYSLEVFRHCMRVPDRQKRYRKFCRQALMALSPAAAATPVTPANYPPASWKYVLNHRVRETALDLWGKESVFELPEPVVKLIRLFTGVAPDAPFVVPAAFKNYLRDQFVEDASLAALLDRQHVDRALRNIDEVSFYCFWTVVMLDKVCRPRAC